ncbi:NAD(P)H-binding protein [Rheinheimera sp.]|uniref:NAD(P)H-binding protein n=1 Tax=Rheinheimera sp. TaxID=1869214 RepID=UPI00307DDBC1
MKLILVGAGWLARQLWHPLQQAGLAVFLTSRSAQTAAEFGTAGLVLPLNGDELQDQSVLQLFAGAVVVCLVPASRKQPQQYLSALDALAALMQKAGSLACIHISSTGIYQGLTGLVCENARLDLTDPRVNLLSQAELILQRSCDVCTLRLSGLIGPGRHPGRFLAGKVSSDPDGAVNMVHSSDVAAFILQVLQQRLWPAVFNLSCPQFCSRRAFYLKACADLGGPEPVFADEKAPERQIDSSKSLQVAGFQYGCLSAIDAIAYC